jgi:hypothetical protein
VLSAINWHNTVQCHECVSGCPCFQGVAVTWVRGWAEELCITQRQLGRRRSCCGSFFVVVGCIFVVISKGGPHLGTQPYRRSVSPAAWPAIHIRVLWGRVLRVSGEVGDFPGVQALPAASGGWVRGKAVLQVLLRERQAMPQAQALSRPDFGSSAGVGWSFGIFRPVVTTGLFSGQLHCCFRTPEFYSGQLRLVSGTTHVSMCYQVSYAHEL